MEAAQATHRRRFASLLALAQQAWHTFERFPLTIIAAVIAAAVAHYMVELDVVDDIAWQALAPVLMVAILGIPLFYALRVLEESRDWSIGVRLPVAVAGLLALYIYYQILPVPVKGADFTTYYLLLTGVILAASFLPFLGRRSEEDGFWQYNKVMLLRLVTALLYSAVLWIGMSLVGWASETLLGFDFDDEAYLQIGIWIFLVYNTWFFLAGIPEDIRGLDQRRDYPTALRIFTQYLLVPLVVVYMIILYAYMAKIVIQWDLPRGWVGYHVAFAAVPGMLALLLVHPVREHSESKWIVPYARYFYWALYPLIILMAVWIFTRISDYGITENRYLTVVATAWVLGIALYFTVRRKGDIRVIPISLCIVSVLTAFGPWGATAFARRSQLPRLREILTVNEVMVDGKLDHSTKHVPFRSKKQISSSVEYVIWYHGADRIRDWYAEPERLPDVMTAPIAMREMGLEYVRPWARVPEGYVIDTSAPNPIHVAGFDYVYRLNRVDADTARWSTMVEGTTELSLEGTTLQLARRDDPAGRVTIDLAPLLIELREKQELGEPYDREETTVEAESPAYRLLMYLRYAAGGGEGDSITINRLDATILIEVK